MDKTEMMEAKYYRPTIEEFHVGVEFEWYGGLITNSNPSRWNHCILDHTMKYRLDSIKTGIENEHIRVKYLDHEDILECGWKEWCKEDVYELWDKDKRYWQLHTEGYVDREDGAKALDLYEGNEGVGGRSQNILLWCRNKSELKTLMKQFGIT